MPRSLHDALEETLGFIQRALDRIRAGDNAEAELHEAFLRFRDRLAVAMPGQLARDMGLE